jgi:asparagine synthetase B (glutamine-hydrolysing)
MCGIFGIVGNVADASDTTHTHTHTHMQKLAVEFNKMKPRGPDNSQLVAYNENVVIDYKNSTHGLEQLTSDADAAAVVTPSVSTTSVTTTTEADSENKTPNVGYFD